MTRHLDLGCGAVPRNPLNASCVYGTDQSASFVSARVVRCALGLEEIPFDSNFFDSVSAYDLLEHIPRQAIDFSAGKIIYPFVGLMNEIYRVLKPGGRFIALTPAYPAKQAFQDPTHVNFISEDTHLYFCDSGENSARYGFDGQFSTLRAEWVLPEEMYVQPISFRLRVKKFRYRYFGNRLTHFMWDLKAEK